MVKPGYKSSEFILSFVAMLVGALIASGLLDVTTTEIDNKIAGLIAMVLTAMGYSVSRAWTKASASKADAIAASLKGGDADPTE